MRLVIATPLYPPELGGPATYTKLLETELPGRGVEVAIVKFGEVKHLPKLVRHYTYFLKVVKAIQRRDIVYALDPVSVGVPAWVASLVKGRPFYLRIAGDYAWEQGTQRYGVAEILDDFVLRTDYPFQVRLLKWVQKFVALRAKRIVVPSEYLKRMVTAWGVPAEKISVVYNSSHVPERSTLLRPAFVSGPYIITAGRLVPWKGIADVIRAFETLSKEDAKLTLVIAGDGPERVRLKALAKDAGLIERIVFTGALPPAEMSAYIAYADCLILGTRYEGFAHIILESFALGVPVATTNVGGNPEVVEHEVTGLMFSYGDAKAIAAAVSRIRSDATLREQLVAHASRKLGNFTRERTVVGTLNALGTAI